MPRSESNDATFKQVLAYLRPGQHRALMTLARRKNRTLPEGAKVSMSSLIRDALDRHLKEAK